MQENTPNAMDVLPLEEVVPDPVGMLPYSVSFPEFDAVAAGEKLAKETTVLELHIRRPGFRKPIPPAEFIRKIKAAGEQSLTPEQEKILAQYKASITTTEGPDGEKTDATMLHISQDILDRKECLKIAYADDRFVRWIKGLSIPSPMLADGMFQIHLSKVELIDSAVGQFVNFRQGYINNFRDKYLELREAAKMRRWPFYDDADYPEWSTIETKYSVEARFLTFNVPAALEKINSEIYKKEQAKATLQWADAAQEARDAQRIAFQELLDHYVTMLGKDDTGKRKTFRPTAVKKLQDFLTMFNEINLTGDLQLEQIVNMTKEIVSGIEPSMLKKDLTLRDTMLDAVTKLKAQTSQLVVVRERKVVFEDAPTDEEESEALPLN